MNLIARLLDRLAAADPALARLRMASRTTLTLAAVALTLTGIYFVHPLPIAGFGIGIITAFLGALAIRDASAGARAVTRVWCALAAFVAMATVSALEPHTRIIDGFFLVVIFVAVWARRFGLRWTAVGMMAFMATFMAAYLRPGIGDLVGVAIAIVASSIVGHFVRNVVLPERPERDFAVALSATETRLNRLRDALAAMAGGGRPTPDTAREIVGMEAALKNALLTAEGYLPGEAADPAAEELRRNMVVALFDLHLAVETRFFVGFDETTGRSRGGEVEAADRRIDEALGAVKDLAHVLPKAAFEGEPLRPSPPGGPLPKSSLLTGPSTKTAVQVTLASALAMIGGIWISQTRWFWAILTAFIVFNNTQSRGDTALRGMARALGTLFGIVAGIALATILAGKTVLSIVLIAVFVFVGFYYLIVSYAVMVFFITLVVALLYGLLGQFSPELLLLRLEETVVGAAAGIFISFIVFPRSTSSTAAAAVEDYFAAFDDLLATARDAILNGTPVKLIRKVRELDRCYDALEAAARPLGSQWQLVRHPGRVRRTLIRFRGCAHWARIFADNCRAELARSDRDADRARAIAAAIDDLRDEAAKARAAAPSFFGREAAFLGRPPLDERGHVPIWADRADPRFALAVMAHILDGQRRREAEARQEAHDAAAAAP